MLVFRSALFNICFYLVLVITVVVYSPIFFLPRRVGWPLIAFWGRVNLWLLRFIAGIKIEVRGRENLPSGGYLVASKHQSAWETFALLPEFPFPCFVLKRELQWIPLFGWYAIKMAMIPVDRGKRSAALLAMTEHARRVIADDRQILIFPEGTRRPAGAEPAYKWGIAHLYRDLGCPVVPVALNSGLFWPRRTFLRFPGTIVMEIMPPIEPGLTIDAVYARLRERIEAASDRLILEAAAARRPPPRARELAKAIRLRDAAKAHTRGEGTQAG